MKPFTVRQVAPGPETFGPFTASPIKVGKHPSCEVYLVSPHVSRTHALLEWRDDALWVTDLATVSGVFLGGKRIDARVPTKLSSGDEIVVGDRRLVVSWE